MLYWSSTSFWAELEVTYDAQTFSGGRRVLDISIIKLYLCRFHLFAASHLCQSWGKIVEGNCCMLWFFIFFAGNTWQTVVLHDIDFCRQACGTLTFSPWWCTTATSWTWQAISAQIPLSSHSLLFLHYSLLAFDWLIDQLSCLLLNRGVVCCDWYHDYSEARLLPPLLSSPNPICEF